MPDLRDTLRSIRTFPQLVKFLRDEMDWPIDSEDFRAFAPPGGAARMPISRIRRGPIAVGLSDPGAVSLTGMTELCVYVSGRVPRGANAVTFGSRELAKEQSALLVVTYRGR